MSLFDRFGRDGKPSFVANNGAPRRKPANLFLNLDYDDWPDKMVMIYLRDRAVWIWGEPENSLLIQRLNDIIHRTDPDENSVQGI